MPRPGRTSADDATPSPLASLVTQAKDETKDEKTTLEPDVRRKDGPPPPGDQPQEEEAARPRGLCRCFRSASPKPIKSSSVVPNQAEKGQTQPPGNEEPQLGPQADHRIGQKTLVLDLDETLVHSSFKQVPEPDIILTVELEDELHNVYVKKRPGVDEFLKTVGELYEIVVYTASMEKYASPLVDRLNETAGGVVDFKLFREACTQHPKGYVKDLSRLGRPLNHICIIDNSPMCYALQPENAIPIKTWRTDPNDIELIDLIPILQALADVDNIPEVLQQIIWCEDPDAAAGASMSASAGEEVTSASGSVASGIACDEGNDVPPKRGAAASSRR